MSDFAYTVQTQKSFADVERAVKDAVAVKGLRVLRVLDAAK